MSGHTPTPGPWTQGGIANPDSDNPTTWIYGPRAAPDHQSGPCVAKDVRLADAPTICAAPATAAELERANTTIAELVEAMNAAKPILQNFAETDETERIYIKFCDALARAETSHAD